MAKISENTMRELDEILNDTNPNPDRLTAFLRQKTAPKPRSSPRYALGGQDMSFDVDVDLIKLPDKQPQQKQAALSKNTQKAATKQTGHETANKSIVANGQKLVNEPDNLPALRRSQSASPSQATGGVVPDADKLRRVAVSRRSLGRRDLLQQFETVADKTPTTSFSSFDFLPKVSSTPAAAVTRESQQKKQLQPAKAAPAALESLANHDAFELSFQANLMQMERTGELPFTLSATQTNQHTINHTSKQQASRRTFTIKDETDLEPESEPAPAPAPEEQPFNMGQQTTKPSSPASSNATSSPKPKLMQTRVRVRRLSLFQDCTQKKPAAECEVPETQQQDLPPAASPDTDSAPDFVSCGVQTSCAPLTRPEPTAEDADDTDTPPLNLAPAGGNTTSNETTTQLLDLHRTRCTRLSPQRPPQASALNKPSRPAINGEQFAEELARMSNYEILDLRKRNSVGRLSTDQLALEQSIQMEIVRRNLTGQGDNLPSKVIATSKSPPKSLRRSLAVDHSQRIYEQSALLQPPRRRCNKRCGAPITSELLNYLQISQTIEQRLKTRSSRSGSKRYLYTKGHSDTEDDLSQSAPKHSRLSESSIQIAPGPPIRTSSIDDIRHISIVPPPPDSIRYSRLARRSMSLSSFEQQRQPTNDSVLAVDDQTVEILEDIPIVPPPPVSLRYSRQFSRPSRSSGIPSVPSDDELQQARGAQAEILENITIVPPPPAALRYSRQLRRSQAAISAETEEDQVQQLEIVENISIVPPPSASSQSRRSVRFRSVDELFVPPQEFIYAEEEQEEEEERQDTAAEQEEEHEQEQEEVMQQSARMEELRVQSPTPPPPSPPLDEQPSTSRAARQALELSIRNEGRKKETPKAKSKQSDLDDGVFKKPLAPAYISKKKRTNELTNLHINLANETFTPELNESNATVDETGIRRSKRGHVPLRNTWVHSISEPFKFTFFERSLSTYSKSAKDDSKQNRNSSQGTRGRPKKSSPGISSQLNEDSERNSASDRSNRSLKRKREQQLDSPHQSDLDNIPEEQEEEGEQEQEQDQQQEQEQEQAPQVVQISPVREAPTRKKRRQRLPSDDSPKQKRLPKKKQIIRNDTESDSEPESRPESAAETGTAAETEPLVLALMEAADELPAELEPLPAQLQPAPVLSEPQTQLLQLTDWLRGANDKAPAAPEDVANENENDAMRYTSACDLEFSTLEGVEYCFYGTEDRCAMGYMRFQPLQERGMKRNKKNTLRFVAIYGHFDIEVESAPNELRRCILKPGDLVEIKMGSRFNIKNRLNENSVLMVNRK